MELLIAFVIHFVLVQISSFHKYQMGKINMIFIKVEAMQVVVDKDIKPLAIGWDK
jgi:hypothetical protein